LLEAEVAVLVQKQVQVAVVAFVLQHLYLFHLGQQLQ
jgi:hypothetical protein